MKKNDEIVITVTDMGKDGEGIGKYDGYTLFVKNALVGDEVKVKLMKAKKNYGYARLTEIIKPSPYRVTPKCPIANKCGGCSLQHLDYKKQLELKEGMIKSCLERIGGFKDVQTEPIIGMEEPYFYRNKAQFPVGRGKDQKVQIGFYASGSHSIIDTDRCVIQRPETDEIIGKIRSFLEENKISIYDEETHEGLVRHILTRIGFVTGEIMVCLVVNGDTLPKSEKLIESLKEVNGLVSVCLNVNRDKTNVILGDRVIPLYGEPFITDYIGDIKYQISPLSFYQVNPVQTKVLYEKALEFCDLKGEEVVFDLYCGIGTISLFLAQKAKKVYGVEIVKEAIEDANVNAKINGIDNVEFMVGAAEEVIPSLYKEEGIKADVVVVDPPRKGCDERLLETIVAMEPKRVVYVSCDPATLARDLKYLDEKGYRLEKVQGVDQFGHSMHVETVCCLQKVNS